MKQVININFQGRVVPIETTAFELLKNYTESLTGYFANEEGKEEIINDIESRIGELFQERLESGSTCITDDDVNAIIKSMGRPEDFETLDEGQGAAREESKKPESSIPAAEGHKRLYRDENNKIVGGVCAGLANYIGIDVVVVRIIFAILFFSFGIGIIPYLILWIAVPSTATTVIGSARKKLFRDPDDKIVSGVCSGIGNYFGINAWIPRIFFLVPFLTFVFRWMHLGYWDFPEMIRLTFSPTSLIIYIVLWLVIPEALSTTDKLEMKGEKVDMNSIKNTVMEEMKGVGKRMEKAGKEFSAVAVEKGKAFGSEISSASRRTGGGLGNVISLFVKGVLYFIIGVICFGLVMALFGLGIAAFSAFPFKDYVLRDGWQTVFAWGTLIFFITVPIIGVFTWIIRKLARIKSNRRTLRFGFISLWILGWISAICLVANVGRDFRSISKLPVETIALNKPGVNKLVIAPENGKQQFFRRNSGPFRFFEWVIDEDTVMVQNIEVVIAKSSNDSFQVTLQRLSRGSTRVYADTSASRIQYIIQQEDSILHIDRGISINKNDKFRNQRVILTVYVPVNKQFRVESGTGWHTYVEFGPWDENDWEMEPNWNDHKFYWETGVDYVMKADGLFTLDGRPSTSRHDTKVKVSPGRIEVKDGKSHTVITPGAVNVNDENYRYNEFDRKADSVRNIQEKIKKQKTDSIDKKMQELQKMKENLGQSNNDEPLPSSTMNLPTFPALVIMN